MRYLPHTETDIREMLAVIGRDSLDDLFKSIPEKLQLARPLKLPTALSEPELLDELTRLSEANKVNGFSSFVGAGIHRHFAPSMIDHILLRSEFYTAYTPYQPEVAQGTLQAIFEYQTLLSLLLETDVTNASMYDGATGCAEAVLMARRVQRKRNKVLMARSVNPEFKRVTATYLVNTPDDIVEVAFGADGRVDLDDLTNKLNGDIACLVVGHPNYFGVLEDLPALAKAAHDAGALLISTFSEPIAFGIAPGPGRADVDIVCGEGQSFLGAMNFGGPSLGIFSTKEKYLRQMPGRVAGMTKDADGRCGFVLTLSTREQHIRREKATSNICTNQGLMALAATIFLSVMGKQGMRRLAEINLSKAEYAKARIAKLDGYELAFSGPTFNEFVVRSTKPADHVLCDVYPQNILAGVTLAHDYPELDSHLLINVTEAHKKADIDALVDALAAHS
jgi:glycine dehydrogenase subunit 1